MTDPAPTVSIVIPTHDRAAMVPEAVESALSEKNVPVEVLVVDDNSTDETAAWLATQTDPRLRWWTLSPGRGGSGARNFGLAECRGEFVLFLDDDDRLRPGAVALLHAALERHPKAARSSGAHETFGIGVRAHRSIHPRFPVTRDVWRDELFMWSMPPAAILWRTAAVREIGGWDETLRRCEDMDLNLRAHRWPMVVLPTTVVDYRYHSTQAPMRSWWATDAMVRERFVASLTGRDAARGASTLSARRAFQDGYQRYLARDFVAALTRFGRALRLMPSVAMSPILGPWVLGMTAKAAAGSCLPGRVRDRIASGREQRRGAVLDVRIPPDA